MKAKQGGASLECRRSWVWREAHSLAANRVVLCGYAELGPRPFFLKKCCGGLASPRPCVGFGVLLTCHGQQL